MNRRAVCFVVALSIAASLAACGSSANDDSLMGASTTSSPADTTAPSTSTAAPVLTTAASAPSTDVSGGAASCDEASVAAGIGEEVAAILDLQCVEDWAAAFYTDVAGLSRPAILKAEGQFWILQDWYGVCEGDPMVPGDIQVPEALRASCPGG